MGSATCVPIPISAESANVSVSYQVLQNNRTNNTPADADMHVQFPIPRTDGLPDLANRAWCVAHACSANELNRRYFQRGRFFCCK